MVDTPILSPDPSSMKCPSWGVHIWNMSNLISTRCDNTAYCATNTAFPDWPMQRMCKKYNFWAQLVFLPLDPFKKAFHLCNEMEVALLCQWSMDWNMIPVTYLVTFFNKKWKGFCELDQSGKNFSLPQKLILFSFMYKRISAFVSPTLLACIGSSSSLFTNVITRAYLHLSKKFHLACKGSSRSIVPKLWNLATLCVVGNMRVLSNFPYFRLCHDSPFK